jgi:hypothetical protein
MGTKLNMGFQAQADGLKRWVELESWANCGSD